MLRLEQGHENGQCPGDGTPAPTPGAVSHPNIGARVGASVPRPDVSYGCAP
jgi:hypothetical protein